MMKRLRMVFNGCNMVARKDREPQTGSITVPSNSPHIMFLDAVRKAYPEHNCAVLESYLSRYIHMDLDTPAKVQSLAQEEVTVTWADSKLKLTQLDLAKLVARSMLCRHGNQFDCIGIYDKLVDPPRPKGVSEKDHYKRLLQQGQPDPDDIKMLSTEKLRMLFNYFNRIAQRSKASLTGPINVHRISAPNEVSIDHRPLAQVTFMEGYMHEDDLIKVDFANKNIGGGVLGHGCCMEEIMFLCNTELIGLISIVDTLGPREAVVVTGITQYSKARNYGFEMAFDGSCNSGVAQTIIIMDAVDYRDNSIDQYGEFIKIQEMHKAIAGFSGVGPNEVISTGAWGCGAFKGNHVLKFMIQWLAATATQNNLRYYLGDRQCELELRKLHSIFRDANMSDLHARMVSFGNEKRQ